MEQKRDRNVKARQATLAQEGTGGGSLPFRVDRPLTPVPSYFVEARSWIWTNRTVVIP